MNVYVKQEVQNFQEKMNGYVVMFNYRIMNHCVKADPLSFGESAETERLSVGNLSQEEGLSG